MGKILFTILLVSVSLAEAYDLPTELEKAVGQTFFRPGPNCFSAALFGAGVYDSFRGVSENEFSEVLKEACVKVEEPAMGDIGVYQSKGFGFVHAFVYLDEETAFEKPGVDYLGQTPIRIQPQNSVDYVHIASPECRRWGDETCHNTKSYHRCSSVDFAPTFAKNLKVLNGLLELVLVDGDRYFAVQNNIHHYESELKSSAESDLEKSVLESIKKQVDFLGFEAQNLLLY